MAKVSHHRQANRLFIQRFSRGRPPDSATILEAGVLCYFSFPSSGAAGEEFRYFGGKLVHIETVQFFSANRLPLPATLPDVLVGQTFLFRFLQGLRFNQQSLPFISLSSATPFQHHCRKGRMFAGAPGQSRVTGWEEKKMVQIGARQAQGALIPSECNPGLRAEFFTTFIASRFSARDEHFDFLHLTLRFHNLPQSYPIRFIPADVAAFPCSTAGDRQLQRLVSRRSFRSGRRLRKIVSRPVLPDKMGSFDAEWNVHISSQRFQIISRHSLSKITLRSASPQCSRCRVILYKPPW